jgi:dipeptidyl aminopeptidase/acylaminoacyl peptidase
VPLTPERGVRSFRHQVSRHFPDEMLLAHNARDKRYFDVYRVNVATGAQQRVFENDAYGLIISDGRFRLRFAGRYTPQGGIDIVERTEEGDWVSFFSMPISDVDSFRLAEISDDGETLYVINTRGRDKAALIAIDIASRAESVLVADADADVEQAIFDPISRRPVAAAVFAERRTWKPLKDKTAEMIAVLEQHAGGDLGFISSSGDGRLCTVRYEHDAASAEFVLYDVTARAVRPLFLEQPRLAGVPLRPLEPVRFPARDGLPLHGYLTRPSCGGNPLPLVLVVHGGPYWRDYWGLSPTHQWLADRGYAVLSVNYRGSTGYGKAFITAADHEWGGKMHDDLIDAVNWAVAQGIADPKRIGFFGGSYGGYSALTALTRTPETFACIVDFFGISNLITFMASIPPYWSPWFSVWKERLGNPDTEEGRALLIERSPITHIAAAKRPILIAQGLQDVRVVAAESAQMVAALQARNIPVTYITFSDEGHGFVRPANRLAFNAVAEAYLAKYLGGRFQPIGADFTGSTLNVEAGADLIPGLADLPRR